MKWWTLRDFDSAVPVYVLLNCSNPVNFCVAPAMVKAICLIWSNLQPRNPWPTAVSQLPAPSLQKDTWTRRFDWSRSPASCNRVRSDLPPHPVPVRCVLWSSCVQEVILVNLQQLRSEREVVAYQELLGNAFVRKKATECQQKKSVEFVFFRHLQGGKRSAGDQVFFLTRAETNPNISGTNPFRILQTNIGYPRILWPFSQTLLNTLYLSLQAISFVMISSAKVCTMYVLNFLFFSFLLHAASL